MRSSPGAIARSRSGITVVLLVLLMPVVLGLVALSVDVGYLYTSKGRLQSVADVAVLTGIAAVDETKTYTQEDAQVRTRISQTAAVNGLSSSFFSVSTIKNPGTDDVLLARVTANYRTPLFFSGFLGVREANLGIVASAEVIPGQIGYKGGGLALFGDLLVDANGNVFIDSFDSRDGNYNPINTGPDGRPYAKANATVGGNGDADVNGDISFHGDLVIGDDVEITGTSGYVLGSVLCGGSIDAPPSSISGFRVGGFPVPAFNPTPATLPAGVASSNDNWRITGYLDSARLASSQELVKGSGGGPKIIYIPAGGTYYLRLIDLQSDIQVQLTGDPSAEGETLIYLDGPMTVLGGVFNGGSSPKAADLRIVSVVSTPDSAPIKIGGSGGVYADIYAPSQRFTLAGGGVLYGRIFGRKLDLQGNTAVHYDEALLPIEGGVLVARVARRSPHLVQ